MGMYICINKQTHSYNNKSKDLIKLNIKEQQTVATGNDKSIIHNNNNNNKRT